MRSSVKINNNRVDMSGKKVSFNTKEKANKTLTKRAGNRKLNMDKITRNGLGSIPSRVLVNGSLEQRAGTDFLKMVQGSIPTVTGSLTKTELNEAGQKTMGTKDLNHVAYHDTTGVRTEAKASSKSGNNASNDIKNAESNGWVKTEIGWMYNEKGKPVTGWKQIDGKWYYFETNGVMCTGWRTINGKIYYLHSKGDMAESEWIQDKTSKNWYYIKSNGEIAKSEWRQDSAGKWYYVRSNGQMVKSEWRQDSAGKWYYLGSNGEMVTSQMVKGSDGKNYYLGEDGAMVLNKDITWEGTTYHVDGNGVCSSAEDEWNRKIDSFIDIALNERVENTGFIEYQIKVRNEEGELVDEGDNINRYGKWYGDNGVPWCAIYVSWCANEVGILNNEGIAGKDGKPIPKFESCKEGKELYEEARKYHKLDSGYEPKKGDLFIHINRDEDGNLKESGHTGIIVCYDRENKIVYSVEGNSDDRVSVKKTQIDYSVMGYKYFDGFCSNGGTDYGSVPDSPSWRGRERDR